MVLAQNLFFVMKPSNHIFEAAINLDLLPHGTPQSIECVYRLAFIKFGLGFHRGNGHQCGGQMNLVVTLFLTSQHNKS